MAVPVMSCAEKRGKFIEHLKVSKQRLPSGKTSPLRESGFPDDDASAMRKRRGGRRVRPALG
jgi:hypothetical protein